MAKGRAVCGWYGWVDVCACGCVLCGSLCLWTSCVCGVADSTLFYEQGVRQEPQADVAPEENIISSVTAVTYTREAGHVEGAQKRNILIHKHKLHCGHTHRIRHITCRD